MRVTELQSFLNDLSGPLATAGGARFAEQLKEVAQGLEPFGELTLGQFADFLHKADHYVRTGELPPVAKKNKAEPNLERVNEAYKKVKDIYDRCKNDDVDYDLIDQESETLNELNKDEVIAVARKMEIAKHLPSKKAAIEEIRQMIYGRKESFQRTSF